MTLVRCLDAIGLDHMPQMSSCYLCTSTCGLCMLICIFAMPTLTPMTSELVAGSSGIGEEEVAASAPMVRALVVQRLEMIWRSCEPHINPSPEQLELGIRQDPRYIEAGIRVVDRLTSLYGLTKPMHQMSEPDSVSSVDQRALVGEALKVLEDKLGQKAS